MKIQLRYGPGIKRLAQSGDIWAPSTIKEPVNTDDFWIQGCDRDCPERVYNLKDGRPGKIFPSMTAYRNVGSIISLETEED